jgi:hypothetical protein
MARSDLSVTEPLLSYRETTPVTSKTLPCSPAPERAGHSNASYGSSGRFSYPRLTAGLDPYRDEDSRSCGPDAAGADSSSGKHGDTLDPAPESTGDGSRHDAVATVSPAPLAGYPDPPPPALPSVHLSANKHQDALDPALERTDRGFRQRSGSNVGDTQVRSQHIDAPPQQPSLGAEIVQYEQGPLPYATVIAPPQPIPVVRMHLCTHTGWVHT